MHGVQKPASDSGHNYAGGAETCPRFMADLCRGCRNMPQIQDISMHGVQKRASVSGHTYARGAETRLSFRAYLCMGCINVPQIQGISLHRVHKSLPDLGHKNEIPKWFARIRDTFIQGVQLCKQESGLIDKKNP